MLLGKRSFQMSNAPGRYSDDADHIYYNVTITNPTNQPIAAKFEETRTQSILTNPSNYTTSIIRFYFPGNLIPLFYFPDEGGSEQYWVTLEYPSSKGVTTKYSVQVVYGVPPGMSIPLDRAIFSFQEFLEMVNNAFFNAYKNMRDDGNTADFPEPLNDFAAMPPVFTLFDGTVPRFEYDPATQLFFLKAKNDIYFPAMSTPAVGSSVRIWMNRNLSNFFDAMYGFANGYDNADHRDFMAYVSFSGINRIPEQDLSSRISWMPTEVNTHYLWNTVKRLIVTTGIIPIVNEYIFTLNGQNQQQSILTDFEPMATGDQRTNDVYQYFPMGPLRKTNLISTEPLNKFDCSVFWEDKNGNIHPLMISPRQMCTIKFLFERIKI